MPKKGDGKKSAWLCSICLGKDGLPYKNFGHRMDCNICAVSKGKCHLGPAAPSGSPGGVRDRPSLAQRQIKDAAAADAKTKADATKQLKDQGKKLQASLDQVKKLQAQLDEAKKQQAAEAEQVPAAAPGVAAAGATGAKAATDEPDLPKLRAARKQLRDSGWADDDPTAVGLDVRIADAEELQLATKPGSAQLRKAEAKEKKAKQVLDGAEKSCLEAQQQAETAAEVAAAAKATRDQAADAHRAACEEHLAARTKVAAVLPSDAPTAAMAHCAGLREIAQSLPGFDAAASLALEQMLESIHGSVHKQAAVAVAAMAEAADADASLGAAAPPAPRAMVSPADAATGRGTALPPSEPGDTLAMEQRLAELQAQLATGQAQIAQMRLEHSQTQEAWAAQASGLLQDAGLEKAKVDAALAKVSEKILERDAELDKKRKVSGGAAPATA